MRASCRYSPPLEVPGRQCFIAFGGRKTKPGWPRCSAFARLRYGTRHRRGGAFPRSHRGPAPDLRRHRLGQSPGPWTSCVAFCDSVAKALTPTAIIPSRSTSIKPWSNLGCPRKGLHSSVGGNPHSCSATAHHQRAPNVMALLGDPSSQGSKDGRPKGERLSQA